MFHTLGRLRLVATGLVITMLMPIAVAAAPANPAPPVPNGRVFPETGHVLDAPFLTYYDQHSGSRVFGAPITESYQEGGRLVQVFERGRLEYNTDTRAVTPTAMGRLLTAGRAADPGVAISFTPPGLYDTVTGHGVAPVFTEYWLAA